MCSHHAVQEEDGFWILLQNVNYNPRPKAKTSVCKPGLQFWRNGKYLARMTSSKFRRKLTVPQNNILTVKRGGGSIMLCGSV